VLPHGSYALVACAQLRCATAERHLQVGPAVHAQPVRLKAGASKSCASGAHSLSSFGDHVYPETGNGGYASVHTDVFLTYDAATNLFLPGTHVVLTDQATAVLTDFSLDFERTSANTKGGPNMTVDSVLVNGRPASFTLVQPTYPGRSERTERSRPARARGWRADPVGGPENNPFPPGLLTGVAVDQSEQADLAGRDAMSREQARDHAGHPDSERARFVVQVGYTGSPGLHNDGDGTTEGWFRVSQPGDTGGFVTTEPVATEDWMPLNNHRARSRRTTSTTPCRSARRRLRPASSSRSWRTCRIRISRAARHVALALAGRRRLVSRREQHRLV